MARGMLMFFILWAAFAFGISAYRELTGKMKWQLIKTLGYGIVCAIAAITTLTAIVVLF